MIIYHADVFTQENGFQKMDIHIEGERIAGLSQAGGPAEGKGAAGCGAQDGQAYISQAQTEQTCNSERQACGSESCGAEKCDEKLKDFVENADELVIDAQDCYVIPGLVDIHFHGCMGSDLCDGTKEALEQIAAYQASCGVTSIVPATMTLSGQELEKICEAAAAYHEMQQHGEGKRQSFLGGIYMEGPFISKEKKGAQNEKFILLPSQELFETLQDKSKGLIKVVAIAPEAEGAMRFIAQNKDRVKLSLAHTNADYDSCVSAFEAGADQVTHLYNAMAPYTHRAPGLVGAAADCGAYVELICDGVHIHPAVVRNTIKLFGKDKVILISDSMRAAGLADGSYTLGGQPVEVRGNLALLADGTIAGSVSNLMDCMRRAVLEMKVPLETAVQCACANPAKRAGIFDERGSIAKGKIADLVLLRKKDLRVKQVVLRGEIL